MMRDLLERETRAWRKSYFLAKYPYLCYHLPVLQTTFDEARYVHIVRDGRAVALSLEDTYLDIEARGRPLRKDGRVVPTSDTTGLTERDALTRGAAYWAECVDLVQQAKSDMNILEFRYEDLCPSVHEHLGRVLEHVGLDVGRFPFDHIPRTLVSTNDRRLRSGTAEDLAMMQEQLSELLTAYSYT